MDKKQKKNKYGKFEASRVNGAARAITAPVRAVHYAANPPSLHTGELQGQMNKWIMLVLSSAATFMTTLDASIVNIGLPSIARTFHVEISGATEWIIIGYFFLIPPFLPPFLPLAYIIRREPLFLT